VRIHIPAGHDTHHLPVYGSILDGELWPQYLHAGAWGVEFDPDASTQVLMDIHDAAVKGLRDTGVMAEPHANGDPRPAPVEGSLLDLKIELARRLGAVCELCQRRCRADRAGGKAGTCGVVESRISSSFLHHGEEHELVPSHTIFFAGCNLECHFCQNHDISRRPRAGTALTPADCADLIVREEWASRNVNWVGGDPIPNVPFILETLKVLESERPRPQVFNSNMFMTEETLRLLDGVVDVYLTDFKYGNNDCARRLSRVRGYFDVVSRNHKKAFEQAELLVRHLVLPNHVECCSKPIMDWLAENIGPVRLNVMDQYRPVYHALEHPDISRRLTTKEFLEAYHHAEALGHLGLD
jgi:putative pyruvate formate lyase activating enzyme